MRLKTNKSSKDERVSFRCTTEEFNELQRKANIYTDGNLSEYLIYAGKNFVPSKEDFEETQKSPSKRKGQRKVKSS
jgi:poly(A) polymerase Pap1